MLRVITAIILVLLALLALFKAPISLFSLIVGIVAVLATYEYLSLVKAHELQPLWILTMLAIAFSVVTSYLNIRFRSMRMPPPSAHGWRVILEPVYLYQVMLLLVGIAPFIMLAAAMRNQNLRVALPSAAASYLAVPYIGVTCTFLLIIRALAPNGALAIFYMFIVVWVGDIFAYYVGRFLGRHKMAPQISPNKTWEGAVASVMASTIAGTLLLVKNSQVADFANRHGLVQHPSVLFTMQHSQPNVIWIAVLATLFLNIAAQFGDLVESMIKRGANVKDSGVIVPGHGGILDRIDALLLATPVLWYYASFGLIHF
jgi:phosphatidate cytidylyltransferase